MAFEIQIGKNSSASNSLTKNFTASLTLTGSLRDESELINPVITIQTSSSDLLSSNYLKIPSFNRSYFITSIKFIRTNIYQIEAHCDVLSSFASEIKNNSAIILRQENNFNLLLNDDVFKCKQNPRIYYRKFPNSLGNYKYILTVAGGYRS